MVVVPSALVSTVVAKSAAYTKTSVVGCSISILLSPICFLLFLSFWAEDNNNDDDDDEKRRSKTLLQLVGGSVLPRGN